MGTAGGAADESSPAPSGLEVDGDAGEPSSDDPGAVDDGDAEAGERSAADEGAPVVLQKRLQWLGVGTKESVREAIFGGRVRVDGVVCTRFAEPVGATNVLEVDGVTVQARSEPVVWLMYKPIKHLTRVDDEGETPGLGRYLPADAPRMFPVGRLDYNTEGALLWTNDGELARRILHPEHHLVKHYAVKVRGHLAPDDPALERMRAGMRAGRERYLPAEVALGETRTRATWVHIRIREGKFRQVRRMCDAARWQIVKLRRVEIGPIGLGALTPRVARPLTAEETRGLYAAVGLVCPTWASG